jgi:pilus assembly protein Flp/PilA
MLTYSRRMFRSLVSEARSATAIEYGLIAALISIAALSALQAAGPGLQTSFETADRGFVQAHGRF